MLALGSRYNARLRFFPLYLIWFWIQRSSSVTAVTINLTRLSLAMLLYPLEIGQKLLSTNDIQRFFEVSASFFL